MPPLIPPPAPPRDDGPPRDDASCAGRPDDAGVKAAARKAARQVRRTLGGDRAAAARAVAERFMAVFPSPPGPVALYRPLGDELDVLPLLGRLTDAGVPCLLPVCLARGQALVFRRWRPGEPLVPDALGLAAPEPAAPSLTPAIVLVPLLAFDRRGGRLGYGGGFYDRTLEGLRAAGQGLPAAGAPAAGGAPVLAVGVGFAEQEVDKVPMSAHDQPLDWIVTDTWAGPVPG